MTQTDEERDRDLIERAGLIPGGQYTIPARAVAQLLVDLKNALAVQSRGAERLGNKIWWLNFWLLLATVAMLVLTGALAWTPLRAMLR